MDLVPIIFYLSKVTVPQVKSKKALQNKYQFEEGKNVNIFRRREQNFDEVLSSATSKEKSAYPCNG